MQYVRKPIYFPTNQSRKLKSRYRARNRFQEPSLELSSQATNRLAGRYDNPMPIWFLAPIAGLQLLTQFKKAGTLQYNLG